MADLKANTTQSKRVENARRNPAYRQIENTITRLRRQLKQPQGPARQGLIKRLTELERQQRTTASYAKAHKHPTKVGYARATRLVILVQGTTSAAQAIKDQIGKKLQEMGLALSEDQTKLTHWRHRLDFLGYQIHGKRGRKGPSLRPMLSIPQETLRKIKEALRAVSGYYHSPQMDAITQMSALVRGWCHYYRYAKAPQATFSDLSRHTWWCYAHYAARQQKSSSAEMIRRERQAGSLETITKHGRKRFTLKGPVGRTTVILALCPPKTGPIQRLPNMDTWTVDLKPLIPMNWQSGRSLATRMAAWERAHGIWERCHERPVAHVHHPVSLRGKHFLARLMSDSAQRYTALALCKECHREVHGGSYLPRRCKGQVG